MIIIRVDSGKNMSQSDQHISMLNFNFSVNTLKEVLDTYKNMELPDWAEVALSFLRDYNEGNPLWCSTSGTTGPPKKQVFSADQMAYSAKKTLSYFSLKKGDRALLALSANFVAGKLMLVRAIEGNLNLTLVAPKSNPLEGIEVEKKFDFTPLVPLQVFEIMHCVPNDIKRLGKLLIGGGEVASHLVKSLQSVNVQAWSSFGMTETLTHFALRQVSPVEEQAYSSFPEFNIGVDDRDCLTIQNKVLAPDRLLTNDVVQLLNGGRFIWKGRWDNVVNSGGVKLYPETIEKKLKLVIPPDLVFVIISEKSERFGEILVLCFEKPNEIAIPDNKKVASFMKEKADQVLLPFERPKKYFQVSAFQRTSSGKIKRKSILLPKD